MKFEEVPFSALRVGDLVRVTSRHRDAPESLTVFQFRLREVKVYPRGNDVSLFGDHVSTDIAVTLQDDDPWADDPWVDTLERAVEA